MSTRKQIEAVYPLSPMQQGMLFHTLYAPDSGVYFEQLVCSLEGQLDRAAFQQAWQQIIARHAVLRTSFAWRSVERPVQAVHREVNLPLEELDWRSLPAEEQANQLEAYLAADRLRGFDLARAPLIRLALMRTGEESYRFVWSHHHIVMDGWSLATLLREMFALYEALSLGSTLALPPMRPYRDYIAYLQAQDMPAAEAYWRQALAGFTTPTPLVVDRAATAQDSDGPGKVAEQEVRLDAGTGEALASLARQHGLTLSTLVQGAWAVLLHRYSGEEDVVFGTTVSGRPPDLAGTEDMVGVFINTLPARVRVAGDMPLISFLQQLQDTMVEMRQHEYTPLTEIQGWSEVPRGRQLFESILVFENYPVDAALLDNPGSLRIGDVRAFEQTNYPLTLVSGPGRELALKLSYQRQRFDDATIGRMLGHLAVLLQGMADQPAATVAALPLLSTAELEESLVAWNATAGPYPSEHCLHQLFEAQVERLPGATALLYAPEHAGASEPVALTYGELNARANQLAHHLRSLGVGPDTLVGLMVERAPDLLVGLLGILKAGGAYVPMDPTYPAERLALMLQDADVRVLVTERALLSRHERDESPLDVSATRVVALDADWPEIECLPPDNLENVAGPDSLAYVIYTSGSTGLPKGVMVEHRSLVNHIAYLVERYELVPTDRMLQFMSYSFDAAAEELYTPLVGGATMVMPGPARELMGTELASFCHRHGITIVHMPAAPWHQWVDDLAASNGTLDAPIRLLVVGGEEPSMARLRTWVRLLGRPSMVLNAYGPTEATVAATTYLMEATEATVDRLARLPIGQPEPNVQVYVVDSAMRPVPVGVPGELLIAGVGIARGYLNRPQLTAERFGTLRTARAGQLAEHQRLDIAFPGPGAGQPERRVYRTGDTVRWLPDGNLEFLGRVDDQVKVRGFRVELGEIEAVLAGLPGIRQAVVGAREDSILGTRLVAFVVAEDGGTVDGTFLRQRLRQVLPEHMVPSAFVSMEALPLSPTGKVDRNALPTADGHFQDGDLAFVPPRTPEEEILAGLLSQLLRAKRVGATDSFFDLGGHSLLATRLTSRIREVFGVELPLRTIFDHPTVAELAATIGQELRRRGELPGDASPAETLMAEGPQAMSLATGQSMPVSFAQQRLWFLDQLEPGNLFYNIPTAVRLVGELNADALGQALNEIVRRHSVLRTTFQAAGGIPVQIIRDELAVDLPLVDLRALPVYLRQEEALRLATEEIRRPFDLAAGPLVRGLLLRLAEEEHVAVLTIHHVVADGWSMGILVKELTILYQAFVEGKPSPLPDLPLQYADYALWQRAWLGKGGAKSERGEGSPPQPPGAPAEDSPLQGQLNYWREQLQGAPPRLELPTDRPRPAVQSARGAVFSFRLPAQLSQDLLAFAQREGVTLFMTLLAAYQTLLHRYADQDDICVGTAIANRTYAQLEPLMGFFVNTLVLRSRFEENPTFRQLLGRVRETALAAYAHQDMPFEMLVDVLQPERNLSHTPLFQAAFSLQNVPVEPQELPGLRIEPLQLQKGIAQFDMLLMVSETDEGLAGAWEYNADLFDERTISAMASHLQTLLSAAIADPESPVAALPLLTPGERQTILVDWNRTAEDTPIDRCAHQLFEHHAALQPGHPAIVMARPGGMAEPARGPNSMGTDLEMLTYAQLDRRANQLAHYLRKCGVGPETITGVFFDRSPLTFVAILATLKAGGAYLPVDPGYPADRIAFMLQDSQAPVILTVDTLAHRLPDHEAAVICLDEDWPTIALEQDSPPQLAITPFNAAYCIYTSGSTGKPKAAMLRHRGLSNLAHVQRQAFEITPRKRILQFAPLSFDASVWETIMALANGATLVLASQDTLASGPELLRLLQDQSITTVTLPPSLLALLEPGELPELQTVIAAGERCTRDIVQRWAPGRHFFNAYGPTETTVCASLALCNADDPTDPSIGRPIANTKAFVVDRNFQPVPVGVPGELAIGGVNVGRGYLNRPELTAERFIPNPFATDHVDNRRGWGFTSQPLGVSAEAADILYRTGDLVRWRPDGILDFLGRIDHQVKLRGFRIELGEVETALRGHPAVVNAVAVARDDVLVAYFIPEDGQEPPAADLRTFLRQSLPEHMVPAAFVPMDAFPLTPAGKVDRSVLPAPDAARQASVAYLPPRTDTEARLAEMAASLLRLERIGIHDNFFELGGHSLLATQLISRLRDELGVDVPLRTLFEHPTVSGLSAAVEEARQAQSAQQADRERINELLQQVKGLSPEQVQALLAAKRSAAEKG